MKDKFFRDARERFDIHADRIRKDIEYLSYMVYDYEGKLSPAFYMEIEKMKKSLELLDEEISNMEANNVV